LLKTIANCGNIKPMSTRSIHQFAEKISLITDGTNPVGMAVALQLALNGSYVVVGMPNIGASEKPSIAELESLGTLAMSVDWEANEAGAKALVDAVREKFGRLDLLVNCLKLDVSNDLGRTIELNLSSVCYLIEFAKVLMTERPKPRIVNIVSTCDGNVCDPVFSAAQGGIVGLTKALATGLPNHFRVNAASLSEKMAPASGFDPELARPLPLVSPDAAARTVLFLLSGESSGVNGQLISLG
jgi:NAD(P)-dependent dehydrogenase (short-subunit alcohol dehydrogenase family)